MPDLSVEAIGSINSRRLRPILLFFTVLGISGILADLVYGFSVGSIGSCLIWSLSCLTGGIATGFLFAIPKIVQGSQATNEDKESMDYKLQVNTNLTEISDWLTKIIVGLGLVKLTKLPPYLTSMAVAFSNGVHDKDKSVAMAVAYGTITFFSVLGFLFGYLFTRLFLSKAISIADQDSIQQLKGQFQIQIANIESKQGFLAHSLASSSQEAASGVKSQIHQIPIDQALENLKRMAGEYMEINIADLAERTRAKDAKANEMGIYALQNGIGSNILFEYIKGQTPFQEGLVLALATLINIDPHQLDFNKLILVGGNLTRLHVRYRVLLAIVTLQKQGYIDDGGKQQAINLVKTYRLHADPPLNRQIDYTLSFLNAKNQ
jgi:hypothetical protein